jgi:hypothetical protein
VITALNQEEEAIKRIANAAREAQHIGDQPFQGGPFHRAARKPAVIIKRRQHRPAFVLLRENEGGAGFPLGVERIKSLLPALPPMIFGCKSRSVPLANFTNEMILDLI